MRHGSRAGCPMSYIRRLTRPPPALSIAARQHRPGLTSFNNKFNGLLMNPYYRPRRSMLYVPGCSTRYLHKARTLKVDSVILDLGDPILVEAKVESRRNVVDAVLSGGYGRREVVVR